MKARVFKLTVVQLTEHLVTRYATATRVWWKGNRPSRLSLATGEHFVIEHADLEQDKTPRFRVRRDIEPSPTA